MSSPTTRRGGFEFKTSRGQMLKRQIGKEDWMVVNPEAPPPETGLPSRIVAVVGERQAPGEPDHWSIFIGPENGPGEVYQVTGDAIDMHYAHEQDVNQLASNDLEWVVVLASDVTDQSPIAQRTVYLANNIRPPSAQTQAEVKKNCQGWVIDIHDELVVSGVLSKAKSTEVHSKKQPVQSEDRQQ